MFIPLVVPLVADIHLCPKQSVFAHSPHPPLLLEREFSHPLCTFSAPFQHRLCTPPSALVPLLQPFCTPFMCPKHLVAPFLREGGFLSQGMSQEWHQNASTRFESRFLSMHAVPLSSVPCGLAKGNPLLGRLVL